MLLKSIFISTPTMTKASKGEFTKNQKEKLVEFALNIGVKTIGWVFT